MSLSVFYRGTKVKFSFELSRRRLMSLAGLAALGVLAVTKPWEYQGLDPEAARAKITEEKIALAAQEQAVRELKDETEKKLTAMTIYLGEMQSQLRRLDALGKRLASVADLDNGEFAFEQPLIEIMGGPEASVTDAPKVDGRDVIDQIEGMMGELASKQKQLSLLESVMMSHHISAESYIAGRPVDSGWLSSQYGIRKDPFNGRPAMHKGLDFASLEEGAGVYATGAGVVTWAGERSGYGQLIEIDHGGGLKTRYGHSKELLVKEGDVVTRGQRIALLGSTGRSTGPHVHYEVLRNNRQIDPYKYVYRSAD
ncbi:M23 family metallopeptidase [Pseudidiomarina andamanensis]|uniref:M23 family metallopeptidase n=1 Tax=Pseudidiomarina andamanensis TaxID=1940690 RepID=A0AA92EUR9_9GAMM|nr:M23 family metallopeptidase [Pseudidiomarina andamanensis]MDS0217612.1 M23 family metallopeptidase [Pseudidiomarina andamanensis]QGT96604.1 M23 family metallopeptidase [Pseudidiomarina andamanensis]